MCSALWCQGRSESPAGRFLLLFWPCAGVDGRRGQGDVRLEDLSCSQSPSAPSAGRIPGAAAHPVTNSAVSSSKCMAVISHRQELPRAGVVWIKEWLLMGELLTRNWEKLQAGSHLWLRTQALPNVCSAVPLPKSKEREVAV